MHGVAAALPSSIYNQHNIENMSLLWNPGVELVDNIFPSRRQDNNVIRDANNRWI